MTEKITSAKNPVLAVRDLQTHFRTQGGLVKAVNGVSFTLQRGEILGIVGESGSGKSVTGLSLMGLVDPPGEIVAGSIRLNGVELANMQEKALRAYRGRRIAIIFQDSMMALDPLMRICGQMTEAILAHEKTGRREARARALAALASVGIADPDARLRAYPHELSGGMRQRVAIAIAMMHRPDVIIADEPTTALDVTIQGQILAQMQHLAHHRHAAMIWISHDLPVVANLAHRIAVMYAGRIVEMGLTREVIARPRHPYTRGLIDSLPAGNRFKPLSRHLPAIAPSLPPLGEGCPFRRRCGRASAQCTRLAPPGHTVSGHMAACWHPLRKGGPVSGGRAQNVHS